LAKRKIIITLIIIYFQKGKNNNKIKINKDKEKDNNILDFNQMLETFHFLIIKLLYLQSIQLVLSFILIQKFKIFNKYIFILI
jgi:hypothetical protein